MEKNCCTINVTELADGFRIEIKGEGLKEKCHTAISNCCSAEGLQKCFQNCCTTGGDKTNCC